MAGSLTRRSVTSTDAEFTAKEYLFVLGAGSRPDACPRVGQAHRHHEPRTQRLSITEVIPFAMDATGRVRRVGGSLMVAIPPEVVEAEGLHEGATVHLRVVRKRRSAFGSVPGLAPWSHEGDWGHD